MHTVGLRIQRDALPDAWRASCVALVMGAVAGVAVAWFGTSAAGPTAGAAAGAAIALISIFAEMQAAWRLRRALAAFAAAFPTDGREAYESWTSEQGIRWPRLGVSVKGRVASYRVVDLVVEVHENSYRVRHRDARRAGDEQARRLGIERAAAD